MRYRILFAVATACALSGCDALSTEKPQQTGSTVRPADGTGPDAVVSDFLAAVRAGDETKSAMLLTPTARQKTKEMEMVVAPPGSQTATYKVDKVEIVPDGAHVSSLWTDKDEDGQEHTDEILWFLRQEPEGWRIAGMATKIFDDLPALILNFEDPADMIRKQRLAEEEMARRSERNLEAKKPSATSQQPR